MGLYFSGKYDAAVEAAKRAIRSYPDFPNAYRWLAAALGQMGRTAEAKEALEQAIAIAPGSFDMYVRGRVPWMRPEDHATCSTACERQGCWGNDGDPTACRDPRRRCGGYSRLMGADEEGTLERLKALRRDFVDPNLTAANSREEGRRSAQTPPRCR